MHLKISRFASCYYKTKIKVQHVTKDSNLTQTLVSQLCHVFTEPDQLLTVLCAPDVKSFMYMGSQV